MKDRKLEWKRYYKKNREKILERRRLKRRKNIIEHSPLTSIQRKLDEEEQEHLKEVYRNYYEDKLYKINKIFWISFFISMPCFLTSIILSENKNLWLLFTIFGWLFLFIEITSFFVDRILEKKMKRIHKKFRRNRGVYDGKCF